MNDDTRILPESLFSLSDMKARGWTDGLIRMLLGEPDRLKRNPVFSSKAPMKLYSPQRVLLLEQSTEFQDVMKGAAKRQEAARRAVDTKRAKVRSDLSRVTIRVPRLRRDRLTARACWHYNCRASERGDFAADANPRCDQDFLDRITVNYLRHCLTDYERELARFVGRIGRVEAYREIKCKVLDAIAGEYPWLATECERQKQDCKEALS